MMRVPSGRSGVTRRQFVGSAATAAAAVLAPKRVSAAPVRDIAEEEPPILFQELALAAIDAAKRAGAQYADVRVSREFVQQWQVGNRSPMETQILGAGVRVLYNGYWGFASGPWWTTAEMTRLAQEATAQAKINARGKPRPVEWIPIPVAHGAWVAPIERDPFMVAPEELADFFSAIGTSVPSAARSVPGVAAEVANSRFIARKVEKTFASTEGALTTQTLYASRGEMMINLMQGQTPIGAIAKRWPAKAAGWENVVQPSIFQELPLLIETGFRRTRAPVKPVDVGRYDLVCSAQLMAAFVAQTIGPTTQLDRALGYEANARGTSFLNDPFEMLGTFKVGAPLLTITANRSMPQGLATVKWDDEGVIPTDFTLVQDGVLNDFQTAREQAGWLKPWCDQHGKTAASRGCANSDNALTLTKQHTPNLALQRGSANISIDDLIAGTKNGIFVDDATVTTDFQGRNGTVNGTAREIKNGKLGPYLANCLPSFNTVELWKNVTALGGAGSESTSSGGDYKGQPSAYTEFSVSAVPASIHGVVVVDGTRRA